MDNDAPDVLGPADVGLTSDASCTEHEEVTRMTPRPNATARLHLLAGMWWRLPRVHGPCNARPTDLSLRRRNVPQGSDRRPGALARSRRGWASRRRTLPAPWGNGS